MLVGFIILPFLDKMKLSAQPDMLWYLVLLTIQYLVFFEATEMVLGGQYHFQMGPGQGCG